MADIFISYGRADRPSAQKLVRLFEKEGWTVWWDCELIAGDKYARVIEKALAESRCVVVLWSRHSVGSDWVYAEAAEGRGRNVLVPVQLDDAQVPLEFRPIQMISLAKSAAANTPARQLIDAVRMALERSGAPPDPRRRPVRSLTPAWRSPKVLAGTIAGLLLLGVVAVWLSAGGSEGKTSGAASHTGTSDKAALVSAAGSGSDASGASATPDPARAATEAKILELHKLMGSAKHAGTPNVPDKLLGYAWTLLALHDPHDAVATEELDRIIAEAGADKDLAARARDVKRWAHAAPNVAIKFRDLMTQADAQLASGDATGLAATRDALKAVLPSAHEVADINTALTSWAALDKQAAPVLATLESENHPVALGAAIRRARDDLVGHDTRKASITRLDEALRRAEQRLKQLESAREDDLRTLATAMQGARSIEDVTARLGELHALLERFAAGEQEAVATKACQPLASSRRTVLQGVTGRDDALAALLKLDEAAGGASTQAVRTCLAAYTQDAEDIVLKVSVTADDEGAAAQVYALAPLLARDESPAAHPRLRARANESCARFETMMTTTEEAKAQLARLDKCFPDPLPPGDIAVRIEALRDACNKVVDAAWSGFKARLSEADKKVESGHYEEASKLLAVLLSEQKKDSDDRIIVQVHLADVTWRENARGRDSGTSDVVNGALSSSERAYEALKSLKSVRDIDGTMTRPRVLSRLGEAYKIHALYWAKRHVKDHRSNSNHQEYSKSTVKYNELHDDLREHHSGDRNARGDLYVKTLEAWAAPMTDQINKLMRSVK